jgi:hypothetical protein
MGGNLEIDCCLPDATVSDGQPSILRIGRLALFLPDVRLPGRQKVWGRLCSEAHVYMDIDFAPWMAWPGTVRRVRGIRYRYEVDGNHRYPAAQDPAVDLSSTLDRTSLGTGAEDFQDFLVDLEVSPEP